MREHADQLGLGKKTTLGWQDWKNMRTSLGVDDHPDLVLFLDTLINEQEFEDFVNDVIYG